jgi:2-oxoglutarate ferredoxin oxidoreductase subunit alpha
MSFNFNLCIGGQQGEGIASLGKILSLALNEYGYYVYGYRNFSSRIKGGPTSYYLRISNEIIESSVRNIDLLLAFDQEAIDNHTHLLTENTIIITEQNFKANLPSKYIHYSFPFEEKGIKLGNKIHSNMVALGVISIIMSVPLDFISSQIKKQFSNKARTIRDLNLKSFDVGKNLSINIPKLKFPKPTKIKNTMVLSGNNAISLGLIAGGCRLMAAYPITPASEIMELMAKNLPSLGGTIIQAEDEIAAITMAIGSSYAGMRSVTATSGPGLSLMGEAISLSGMTEIPIVIIDVQRAGPSTGMPTKQEQSDLDCALYSGHGEFPRIVLSPGNPEECFYDGIHSLNLADKYQCPVIILSDLQLGLSEYSSKIPSYNSIGIDRGKIVSQEILDKRDESESYFPRYNITEDGISPRTLPGQRKGLFYTTGVEHNELGYTDTSPKTRIKMIDKRMKKLNNIELENSFNYNNKNSKILLIGYGSTKGILDEIFKNKDKSVDTIQLRVLSPFPKDSLNNILQKYKNIIFIENNFSNQLYNLFCRYLKMDQRIDIFNKYDGTLINIDEIKSFIERSVNND